MWTAQECWLYVILSFKYWNYFWTSLKNHWLFNVKQQICYPYLERGEFNNIFLNCALIKGRGDQENWVNDFWLSLKKKYRDNGHKYSHASNLPYIFHTKLQFFKILSWNQFTSDFNHYFIKESRKMCSL
jgi:hypothetical protein